MSDADISPFANRSRIHHSTPGSRGRLPGDSEKVKIQTMAPSLKALKKITMSAFVEGVAPPNDGCEVCLCWKKRGACAPPIRV